MNNDNLEVLKEIKSIAEDYTKDIKYKFNNKETKITTIDIKL